MIDALHSPYGAMDADYEDIMAMNPDHELAHLKIPSDTKILEKIFIIRSSMKTQHYDLVGFLSAKMLELVIFRIFINYDFFVYHFLPNRRTVLHFCLFKLLASKKVLFYSSGVQELASKKFGVVGHFVASRFISHIEKPQQNAINAITTVFVPRALNGVRQAINFSDISPKILENTNLKFIVQQNDKDPHHLTTINAKTNFQIVGYLSDEEYNAVLAQSDAYLVHFSPNYELRCSGLILDAYQHGKLFLTNAHPTTMSYGYENENMISYVSPKSDKFGYQLLPNSMPLTGDDCIISWSEFWRISKYV